VKVEPPNDPSTLGCDHKMLQVICSDPGNFSIVFAVCERQEEQEEQEEEEE